jgi:sodium/bile acid cotransporter 7
VVSASVSNLLGVFITPLLVFLLMTPDGSITISGSSVGKIALQLLLPFVMGQLLRTWVLPVIRRITRIALFDKTVIVLVVYAAFSDGVADGIWSMIGPAQLAWLIVACCLLLAVVLGLTELISRALGFDERDKRVVQFCGSKKSLATGLPMAAVLFVGQPVGLLVLPLMLFHQIQLIVCAWLAARYGRAAGAQETYAA